MTAARSAAFDEMAQPIRTATVGDSEADFRPLSALKIGNFTKLEKVTEAGEIKALSKAEAKEGCGLETFGGIFSLSRKAIINDNPEVSARWGEMMGQAAAETKAWQLLALLSANAGAGLTMMDGKTPVNVVPRFFVVSPARETAAGKVLTSIRANITADVNALGGKLTLIVEPRLS